ncbi:hypothetical protein ACFQUU_05020 [Herbaspirillum sp. GCM10030257]|uniref:hypothetical protein n=1 Tax=Herbaspirillum sp. GCM10030257 TaxID=3273393 RepID=UPI0036136524
MTARELVISKADAAERQLCTAIWLWFQDMDPVSIHGLATAALKVLWRLHQRFGTGYRTFEETMLEDFIRADKRKEVIEICNATANFIKHSDKDPFAFHKFNPESTIFVMVDASSALQALNGRLPMECQALHAWMAVHHADLFKQDDPHVQARLALVSGLRGTLASKSDFYQQYIKMTQRATAQAAAMHKPSDLPLQSFK